MRVRLDCIKPSLAVRLFRLVLFTAVWLKEQDAMLRLELKRILDGVCVAVVINDTTQQFGHLHTFVAPAPYPLELEAQH